MYHSIVVPLDGSPFGEQALPLALSIAQRAEVPIDVVHVHVPLAPMYAESAAGLETTLDPRIRDQEEAYLNDIVKRIAAVSRCRICTKLLDGSVADAIREHAQARSADLIVMTTHGRGPFSRFWLGSAADQLVRRSSTPILLVHPSERAPELATKSAPRRIVIPLDGSALAEQILDPAVSIGRLMGASYTLLRIVEPIMSVGYDPVTYAYEVVDEQHQARQKQEAQIYLDRVAERLRQQSLQVETRVRISHQPAFGILEYASNEEASWIALETHGRRGLSRVLLGSVADKVIRGATMPVLVSRPK
jgi:nucleotide-binding universal stress UspA family protein